MSKIWNFEGNGTNYISDVYKILQEYKSGLESQCILSVNIEVSMTKRSNARYRFLVGRYNTPIFDLVVKHSGDIDMEISYYMKKNKTSTSVEKLESVLDGIINSEQMGSLIGYLIKLEQIKNETN
jgi:hypothetical protein